MNMEVSIVQACIDTIEAKRCETVDTIVYDAPGSCGQRLKTSEEEPEEVSDTEGKKRIQAAVRYAETSSKHFVNSCRRKRLHGESAFVVDTFPYILEPEYLNNIKAFTFEHPLPESCERLIKEVYVGVGNVIPPQDTLLFFQNAGLYLNDDPKLFEQFYDTSITLLCFNEDRSKIVGGVMVQLIKFRDNHVAGYIPVLAKLDKELKGLGEYLFRYAIWLVHRINKSILTWDASEHCVCEPCVYIQSVGYDYKEVTINRKKRTRCVSSKWIDPGRSFWQSWCSTDPEDLSEAAFVNLQLHKLWKKRETPGHNVHDIIDENLKPMRNKLI